MVQRRDAVCNNKELRELPESDFFFFHTFKHNEK